MTHKLRIIILATLLTGSLTARAQSFSDILESEPGENTIYPVFNYVYTKGYPIGFQLGPVRLGFSSGDARYRIHPDEYFDPSWSLHVTLAGGITAIGPVGIILGIDYGENFGTRYAIDPMDAGNNFHMQDYYSSVAPMIGISLWWINAYVGYELYPSLDALNGMIFGIGFNLVSER